MGVWAAILMAAMVYLTGPRLILLGLAFFGLMEIWGGNIELLVAWRSCSASAGRRPGRSCC
jgi:hypothetical protein